MAWQGQFDDFSQFSSVPEKNVPGWHPTTNQRPPAQQQLRQNIANISAGTSATVIGVVINREEPRAIPSKKDAGSDRYVLCMTLRDSPADFINAACWGTEKYIAQLAGLVHIGDVIQISNALVQSKPNDGTDEKFRPWTPSLYQLTVSENRSTVSLYNGYDSNMYLQLSHIPVKPSNDYYSLTDVITNGQNLTGELVNILAVVKQIGQVKEITTKTGKKTKRCEIKLWDETHPSLGLVLWDKELTNLATTLTPMDNVLFIADVRVNYDNFRKTMVATATAKTIITVNPDTQDAHKLYSMAQSADIPQAPDATFRMDMANDSDIDLNSITRVYRVCEMEEKLQSMHLCSTSAGDSSEFGIIYAYLSQLDLDGSLDNCISIKCGKCRQRVDLGIGYCMNQDCPAQSAMAGGDSGQLDTQFNIRVGLTDHTGTIHGAFLLGDTAANMLGCSVQDFLDMDEYARTSLKWQFLLEKCKVYLKMVLPTYERRRSLLKVISCQKASLHEAVRFLH